MRIIQNVSTGILLGSALCLVLPWQCAMAESANSRPELLESLDGHWIMVGDVMGKPVEYDMKAFPTLQGTFTEVHMKDVEIPSQYEARVFIGVTENGKVIVHWLDSFGAKGSVPHGTGAIDGNTITFKFPGQRVNGQRVKSCPVPVS